MDKENVISIQAKDYFEDPLIEVIRDGVKKLLAFGLRVVVLSDYQPERQIQTGVGPINRQLLGQLVANGRNSDKAS